MTEALTTAPELYASSQAMADIEKLIEALWASGEWSIDHDPILERWRAARGDAALSRWCWWAKEAEAENYENECLTREAAIAWARKEYPGKAITIIECRYFDDFFNDEEMIWFAESRNEETLPGEVA